MILSSFEIQLLIRLLLATLLGGLIGLERELHGRPAGFRTHLMVALGAALYMGVSLHFYQVYGALSGNLAVRVDPGRVAAQIVVGIGFLGAGAIIRENASVRGLTTAACLWVAAAIGTACGAGMLLIAVVVTAISLVSLLVLKRVEEGLSRDIYQQVMVSSEYREGQSERIAQAVRDCGSDLMESGIARDVEAGTVTFEFRVRVISGIATCKLVDVLSGIEGVKLVSLR
ncbi:MgtC/SapB family protein [Trichlorobacter lovleyi]|uniref:MgtC/SapB transporter n=1 Tax=Trichlorobacter lovleyi (strain ATCC BAA-1151 / DSM 17278 / SZ) TaxID=398767 RepID=B3E7R2_TRIL1|nr:MgtC/SapB family protein [Trichlorobacter lovleyi]ACD95044.1 MgtC/SapB transporter [Trichlorobacter lovleyi SZ]